MRVGVLVERALACARAELVGGAAVGEPVASSAFETTSSSRPGSNHVSIPSTGFDTIAAPAIASSNGRAVDDARTVACARRVTLSATRVAEIARLNALNGITPSVLAFPTSPRKSSPPSAKSTSGRRREGSPMSSRIHSRRNLSP